MTYAEKSGYDAAAEAGRAPEAQTPAVERRKTADEVGAERAKAAGEWVSKKWEGAKGAVGKAGSFLKRLGRGLLAPDVVLANAGQAVGGAAKEGYKYASEKVKGAATVAGEKMKGAWERVNATKERIFTASKERFNKICETGRKVRDGLIDKVKDAAVRVAIAGLLAERNRVAAKNERQTDRLQALMDQIAANREAIDGIDVRIAALKERKAGGAEASTAGATA